jgi:hypothetical protein
MLARFLVSGANIIVDCLTRLLGQLEANRAAAPSLPNGSTIGEVAMRSDVLHFDGDDITTTQLAIDCQVEHRKVAHSPFELEPRVIDQTCFGLRAGFGAASLPLFQATRGDFWVTSTRSDLVNSSVAEERKHARQPAGLSIRVRFLGKLVV